VFHPDDDLHARPDEVLRLIRDVPGSSIGTRHREKRSLVDRSTLIVLSVCVVALCLLVNQFAREKRRQGQLWADADFLAFVSFLGRRRSALPVAVTVTLRPWPRAAEDVSSMVAHETSETRRVR